MLIAISGLLLKSQGLVASDIIAPAIISNFFGFLGGENRAANVVWLVLEVVPPKVPAPLVPTPTPTTEPVL